MAQATPRKRIAQIGFVTIGLPFAAFKILFGLAFPKIWPGIGGDIGGIALVALGGADLIVNILNSVFLMLRGKALTQVCVLAILFGLYGRSRQASRSADFGTALDTMLAFSLVAAAIGFNLFPRFGETERALWNISVVVNVLGTGISRIMISVLRAD